MIKQCCVKNSIWLLQYKGRKEYPRPLYI